MVNTQFSDFWPSISLLAGWKGICGSVGQWRFKLL